MKIKLIVTVLIVALIGTLIFAGIQTSKLKESQNKLTLVQESLANSHQVIEIVEREIDVAKQELLVSDEQLKIALEQLHAKP
jgi:hypothetical protein